MAGARQNLFKWNRQTKPNSNYSRGDVQDWIKRVERASTEAAREVFGSNYQSVLEQVHVDDDALLEAQDLLDSWMHEKERDDFNLEVQFRDEKWAQGTTPFAAGSARDLSPGDSLSHLSNDHTWQSQTWANSYQNNLLPNAMGAEYDDELNDEISVQQILRGMLDKEVVKKDVLNDLGFDTNRQRRDPSTKMELRHKQVKAKSKARQKELETKRREYTAHKQAEAEARQQLLREEKEQQVRERREEDAIQQEMTKIRRAMEEEKKAAKEKLDHDLRKNQEAEMLARQYLEEEQRLKQQQQTLEIEQKEEMRRMLLEQMEIKAAEEASENLRVLQKHFSAWYSVVATQRIKLGKARALSDWRCKLKAWNAWQAYVNHIKYDKEAQAVAQEMKEKHRKEQLASKFFRRRQLSWCFRAWQQWMSRVQEERQLREEHQKKTQKMAALLEAAATGKLWSKQGGVGMALELEDIEDETDGQAGYGSRASIARKVDEIFSQPARQIPLKHSVAAETKLQNGSSKRMKNETKPAAHKSAWMNKEEQPTKHTTKENNAKIKSHRQQNYSEVDHIQSLYSPSAQEQERKETNTLTSGTVRTTSAERLTRQDSRSDRETERILSSERTDNTALVNSRASVTPSKLTFRESAVKSRKAATKPLHLAMEERAEERRNRKAALEEKKRKAEEEKLAFLKMEQERKEAELLAEKQEALRKRKEEKRLARERELEKQRHLEHSRQQMALAEQHYATSLLRKCGLLPWKRLVVMMHENMSCAVLHFNQLSLRSCFYPWLEFTRQVQEERQKAAEALYHSLLIRRTWRQWRKYGQHAVRLQMVAEDYCSSYLLRKYFKYWQDYVTEEQIMLWEKERRADQHNEWRLMKTAVIYWKKYIPLVRSERDREKRKAELRKRVHSWLPDFQGGSNSPP